MATPLAERSMEAMVPVSDWFDISRMTWAAWSILSWVDMAQAEEPQPRRRKPDRTEASNREE
jgi:hypothetical protein